MEAAKIVQPLPYGGLAGLSETMLNEHHDVLYTGYVNKFNQIRKAILAADQEAANATYSEIGELKRQETFALNAIKLHEAYFNNLGGNGQITGPIEQLIAKDFGSVNQWLADFKAAGLAARGWVVLAYDWDDKVLRNTSLDLHNLGPVFNQTPLLVLDVYEHAYFTDYGTKRKAYIEAFFKNLNWDYVNRQLERYNILNHCNS